MLFYEIFLDINHWSRSSCHYEIKKYCLGGSHLDDPRRRSGRYSGRGNPDRVSCDLKETATRQEAGRHERYFFSYAPSCEWANSGDIRDTRPLQPQIAPKKLNSSRI